MKINGIEAQNLYRAYQTDGVKAAAASETKKKPEAQASGDTLELSPDAAALRDARALSADAGKAGDAEHLKRLAQVKAAVADGSYRVEPEQVAQSILKGTRLDRRA